MGFYIEWHLCAADSVNAANQSLQAQNVGMLILHALPATVDKLIAWYM